MSDMIEFVWSELNRQIEDLRRTSEAAKRIERAEIADNIPAYTLATAPLAADGGLGDGVSYVTLAWISNGRKSGEGAGLGTGVLAVYQASSNTWLRINDYTAVVV